MNYFIFYWFMSSIWWKCILKREKMMKYGMKRKKSHGYDENSNPIIMNCTSFCEWDNKKQIETTFEVIMTNSCKWCDSENVQRVRFINTMIIRNVKEKTMNQQEKIKIITFICSSGDKIGVYEVILYMFRMKGICVSINFNQILFVSVFE